MIKIFKIFLISFIIFCTKANANLLRNIQDGINEIQKNNFNSAKIFFINYTINNPNDENGYWYLGTIYKKLSDKKNSTKYFKKSYEIKAAKQSMEKITFEDENVNIEDYFDMSAMYYETGNLKEANFYADMMLKIDPKSPSAYFIKAKIALVEGNKDEAKKYLSKAIIFNNELLKTNLAKDLQINSIPETTKEIYYMLALEAYYSGQINEAEKNLKEYLKIEKNAEIYNFLIDCYIKKNDINSAKIILEEYKKTFDDNNLKTNLLEAKIYFLENNKEKQIANLLKAYKINPNNLAVLMELGNFYLDKQDYENAKKYFETLINVNDSYYEAYFGYIYALIETGNLQKAISLTRKAATINTKSSDNEYLLSKICYKEANFKEALEYINEALKKGENPNYYFEKAKIEYYLKNYEKSLANLDKISKDDIQKEKYYIKNYIKLNDTKQLQEFANKKLSLDKNPIIYKYILYILYKLQGDEKNSLSQLAQIKKIKPATPEEYIDLSEIIFETENINSAIKILDNAIKRFPNHYELFSQKIKLYYLAGETEKLKETIEKTQKQYN